MPLFCSLFAPPILPLICPSFCPYPAIMFPLFAFYLPTYFPPISLPYFPPYFPSISPHCPLSTRPDHALILLDICPRICPPPSPYLPFIPPSICPYHAIIVPLFAPYFTLCFPSICTLISPLLSPHISPPYLSFNPTFILSLFAPLLWSSFVPFLSSSCSPPPPSLPLFAP